MRCIHNRSLLYEKKTCVFGEFCRSTHGPLADDAIVTSERFMHFTEKRSKQIRGPISMRNNMAIQARREETKQTKRRTVYTLIGNK